MRHNAPMPRLSMPGDMPEEVLVAIDVIGNNVRTEILRRLARRPVTGHDLAREIGVHPASVHRHLVLLEAHGLVAADVARGKRRGQIVTWRTESDRVADVGRTWIGYATSQDSFPA